MVECRNLFSINKAFVFNRENTHLYYYVIKDHQFSDGFMTNILNCWFLMPNYVYSVCICDDFVILLHSAWCPNHTYSNIC
jgi:hypothetical protein